MPTASERLIWGFGDGSTMPVFETPLGRIGAVICWENYMPLMRAAMYAKGIELYCAPTADPRDSWIASMRHIAVEGRCFVLSCNQFNRRRDFPADYRSAYGDDPDTVISRGGSCIVDPFGNFLAGPNTRVKRYSSPRSIARRSSVASSTSMSSATTPGRTSSAARGRAAEAAGDDRARRAGHCRI